MTAYDARLSQVLTPWGLRASLSRPGANRRLTPSMAPPAHPPTWMGGGGGGGPVAARVVVVVLIQGGGKDDGGRSDSDSGTDGGKCRGGREQEEWVGGNAPAYDGSVIVVP